MDVQLYLIIFFLVFILVMITSVTTTFYARRRELQKKVKLDVTEEEMLESEKRINSFFKDNNMEAGEPISEIAKILNVEQGGIESGLQSQAYLKKCDNTGKKIVVFKAGLSEKEKLFVFAHEIAHLLNGDSVPVTRPNGHNKSQMEQRADYTAAALLMPLDEIYRYMVENEYEKASVRKRTAVIRELCKMYNVTEVIALRRVKEVYVLKQMRKNV